MANPQASVSDRETSAVLRTVPHPLQVTAAWSWRLIVIGVVAMAILGALATLSPLVVPIAIALMIAAPLERIVTILERYKVPRAAGAAALVLSLVFSVLGLFAAASSTIVASLSELGDKAGAGLDRVIEWLSDGPLNLSEQEVRDFLDQAGTTLQQNKSGLVSGAVSVTSTVGALTAGAIIALFCLFFFLKDGRVLWLSVVGVFPEPLRTRVDLAALSGWRMLATFTKTSVFVAFVDAVGIGLTAWALGLSLALPIGILVFLTSFVPLIGALVSGTIAVLVALVDGGWVPAVVMIVAVIIVQQLEGNVLYPWLFGKATAMHPIAIMITISTGMLIGGIVGGLFAVPIVAFVKTSVDALRRSSAGAEVP